MFIDGWYLQVYTVMSFGQLQSIRYAILNFLQDIKVLVSIFVSRDQQYPDGSFKYFPPDRFYKGITDRTMNFGSEMV